MAYRDSKAEFNSFLLALSAKLGLRRKGGTWHMLPNGNSIRVGGGGRYFNVTSHTDDETRIVAALTALKLPVRHRHIQAWGKGDVRVEVERSDWQPGVPVAPPTTPTQRRRSSAEVAAERKAKDERSRERDRIDSIKSRAYYQAMEQYQAAGNVAELQDGMWWSDRQVREIKKLQQPILDALKLAGLL